MKYLVEVLKEIEDATKNQKDYETTSRKLAESVAFDGKNVGIRTVNGISAMTPQGFNGFLDLVGARKSDFRPYLKERTKQMMVMDAAESIPEIPIITRLDSKDNIATVVNKTNTFTNRELAKGLTEFIEKGVIPPTAQVGGYRISDSAHRVDFRVYDESWKHGNNGNTCYAGVKLTNYEFVSNTIQAAIAKVSCFNQTLAEASFDITPENLQRSFEHMRKYSEAMFEQLEKSKSLTFSDAATVFRKIGEEFGLSDGVLSRALIYHQNNPGNSVYDILQAVTDGTKWNTMEEKGRKKIDWDKRDRQETDIFNWLVAMNELDVPVDAYVENSALVNRSEVLDILTSRSEWTPSASYVKNLEPVFV